jgi:hypothetical protein
VLILAAHQHGWTFVERDLAASAPGAYEVWRASRQPDDGLIGDICCVEVHLDEHDAPLGFPDHLLDRCLLGSMTIWPSDELQSFMWWSPQGAECLRQSDALENEALAFAAEVESFPRFASRVFKLGHLLDDTNWSWGWDQGVYCFVSQREVVYVGRALGCTVGDRIARHMRSHDPKWERILADRDTLVRVFPVAKGREYMASAFEAFLIERLHPVLNVKKQ